MYELVQLSPNKKAKRRGSRGSRISAAGSASLLPPSSSHFCTMGAWTEIVFPLHFPFGCTSLLQLMTPCYSLRTISFTEDLDNYAYYKDVF